MIKEGKKKYEIKVQFSDNGEYYYRIKNGPQLPIESGESIYIEKGEIIEFEDLPEGVDYFITVKEIKKGNQKNKKKKEKKEIKKEKEEEKHTLIKDIGYYTMVIILLIFLYMVQSDSTRGPKIIAGYSAYTVLSGSMQDEIPKGSFVLSKKVDAKELEVGDDITFMMSEKRVVTHRIIGINEDYDGTGKRAFETQGIMNKEKDEGEVIEENVIGKVIYHSYALGVVIGWIRNNWVIVLMWMVILYVLQNYYKKRRMEDEEE